MPPLHQCVTCAASVCHIFSQNSISNTCQTWKRRERKRCAICYGITVKYLCSILSDADLQRTTQLLGFDVPALSPNADLITLVYLAHSPSVLPFSPSRLETLLPILVTSIMTNVALDETLAILLYQLNGPSDIPLEVLAALANVIPSLASAHPDPSIRMMTFRLLAQLLARAPQQIHLDILRELTSESEFPQMRSAAIGLVKEAVLDGLSKPMGQNIFASPQFMKTFAPILFKLNPPNLLAPGLSPEEFIETSEPSRISESLGLLYVLLLRDKHNQVS